MKIFTPIYYACQGMATGISWHQPPQMVRRRNRRLRTAVYGLGAQRALPGDAARIFSGLV